MAWNDPSAIDGLSLSALEWRRLQAATLVHDTDAVSARPGVLAGLGVTITTLTVTVAAGSAVVTPAVGSNASYIGVNDANTTLTATAQDATYARIDRVVLRAYDNAVDGSGQNKLVAELITGTPAAAPVAPALPAGRLEIAQLQVPKSGSGSITVVDKRTWTAPLGGPIQVPTVGDLPAAGSAGLRPGIVAVIGSGASYAEYRWTGAAWVQTYVPWTAYMPAVAGLPCTVAEARFHRSGSLVTVQVRLAATGSASGSIAVGLPITPRSYAPTQSVGSAMAVIGAGIYSPAGVGIEGSSVVSFWAPDTGRWGTQANRPAAFTAGSVLSFSVQYEPAT